MRTWLMSLVVALLSVPGIACAHGLLLDAESDGRTITGTVYYTSGELAVQESVELLDLSTPNASAVPSKTDDAGHFSFPVTESHRYRISAYGDEGHSVDVELDASPKSRPALIEKEAPGATTDWTPPAWAVIGGLLLLSLVPAAFARSRKRVTVDGA